MVQSVLSNRPAVRICRKVFLIAWAVCLAMAVCGCASGRDRTILQKNCNGPAKPLLPLDMADQAGAIEMLDYDDIGSAIELVLVFIGSSRDFRPPAGPDGYLLGVIPMDGDSRVECEKGDLVVQLFARHSE